MDYKTLFSNRIKEILKNIYGGNHCKFATTIGVTEGSIRAYAGEKKDKKGNIKITVPTADKIVSIIENIGINSEWLLFGKGHMILSPEQDENFKNAAGKITISLDELKEMKRQISDLIVTNRNLSEVVREKNSVGNA
jgi:hypothetical protein